MSPSTFYCWLAERLYRVVRLQRLLPPISRPLPVLFLVAVPTVAVGVVVGLFWLLVTTIMLANGQWTPTDGLGWRIDRFVWILLAAAIGSFGFATALFSWLVWNQRAARIRAAGGDSAEPPLPPHWGLRWTLGLGYFVVFSLLTPLLLIGCIENALGAYAWRSTRSSLMAQGEKLTVEAVMPGPVPADQNFFSIPQFGGLLKPDFSDSQSTEDTLKGLFRNFQLPYYAVTNRTLPNGKTDPTPTSIHDWADAFRLDAQLASHDGSSTTKAAPNPEETLDEKKARMLKRVIQKPKLRKAKELPEYPAAAAGADDATVIRTALSIGDADFAAIAQALHRPSARYPVRWSDGFNALLPHLARLKGLQQWIELRTRARLAQGDVEGAFEDARTALRLADVEREEPLLISQLVRIAQQAIVARTIDFGIRSHQWTEPQLKEFQAHFTESGMLSAIANSFEGERALGLSTMDAWCSRPTEIGKTLPDQVPIVMLPAVGGVRIPGTVGLIRHNQASLATYYSLLIRSTRATQDAGFHNGFHQELKTLETKMDTSLKALTSSSNPYNTLTRLLAPAVTKAVAKSVRAEQRARLTATACAVERFHWQHGSYPAVLNDLVPTFLSEVPLDIMDRKPLRYRKNADDTFILWSVGDNGVDDGGMYKNPKSKSDEILDWVWPY